MDTADGVMPLPLARPDLHELPEAVRSYVVALERLLHVLIGTTVILAAVIRRVGWRAQWTDTEKLALTTLLDSVPRGSRDALVRLMPIASSTFYRWRLRRPWLRRVGRFTQGAAASVRALIGRIEALCPGIGSRKIAGVLHALLVPISRSSVRRMRKRPEPAAPTGEPLPAFLDPRECRKLWSADFFKVRVFGFLQVSALVVLDDYSRFFAHFAFRLRAPDALWLAAELAAAFARHGAPRRLRTDGERVFAAPAVNAVLAAHGTEHYVTPPGKPFCNGRCERLIGSIRRELLAGRAWLTSAALRSLLHCWQGYYNFYRPHRACGLMPPAARETRLTAAPPLAHKLRPLARNVEAVAFADLEVHGFRLKTGPPPWQRPQA
jgi:transposase InsO family protein